MTQNNKKPKVSIITVCYNEEKDIEKTCESVISQTHCDFEWIVVDGGSTDGTMEILNKYKEKIDVIISEKDNGVYDAMNKGIRLANGEYLLFLNGGDSLYDRNVLHMVFGKNLYNTDILYGNCCVVNSDSSQKILNFSENINKAYFISSNINHQSTFIKKFLFDEYGYYDENYKILADYEKWLCFFRGRVIFKKIPIVVANFKGYDGLSSQEKTKILAEKEKRLIIARYFKSYEIFFYKWIQKINFAFFSPGRFFKKYSSMILSSRLRKPARKIWQLKNKIIFVIFSPKKFYRKYFS